MNKVVVDIVEKGPVCELKKGVDTSITDDCEKLLYLAMAEAKKQPTQIQIKKADGTVKRNIYLPEGLKEEEITRRNRLLGKIGVFLKEVIQLPPELYGIYLEFDEVDDLYDHVIQLVEIKGFEEGSESYNIKYDRGDEIQKRDNIVRLTADFLKANGLSTPQILSDLYNYPSSVSLDQLSGNLQFMIDQRESEVVIIYVVDNPYIDEEVKGELLPVFTENNGSLKIVAWISKEVIPQNLVPVFDIEQNLIGWLDPNQSDNEPGTIY